MKRVFVLTPDFTLPVGGIKIHYQVVDALNASGVDAAIVHGRDGFRCTWFDNQTKVVSHRQVVFSESDLVVVPEEWALLVDELPQRVSKIIFNQNAFNSFGWGMKWDLVKRAYERSDVLRVVADSDHNAQLLRFIFPSIDSRSLRLLIDGNYFYPQSNKRKVIAYMPRKRGEESNEVISILKCRGVLEGWQVVPIAGMTEAKTAEVLRSSAIFLSFSYREGFGLPPAEALASGCIVIGYHGWGGLEMSDEALWVPDGDVLEFVRTVEKVLSTWDDPSWRERAAQAAGQISRNYGADQFRSSVVSAFSHDSGVENDEPCGRLSAKFWKGTGNSRVHRAYWQFISAVQILFLGL